MDVEVARVPARRPGWPASCRRARAHMGLPPTAGRSRGRSRRAMRPCRRSRPRAATRPPRRPARPPTRLPGPGRAGSRVSCVPGGGASGSRGTAPRSRTRCARPSRRGGWTLPSRGTRARPRGCRRGTRFPQPEVEHVLDARVRRRLGLVVAVAHAHGGRAGRHVEREHHVGALERGVELPGDHAMWLQRRIGGARAAGRRGGEAEPDDAPRRTAGPQRRTRPRERACSDRSLCRFPH